MVALSNQEANKIAADDLEKIEAEAEAEAEAAVEDFDKMGDAKAAAEAAETAQEFHDAAAGTEEIKSETD